MSSLIITVSISSRTDRRIDDAALTHYHASVQRNIRLIISYDGTDFHGWQRQPGLRTVQGVIAEFARRILRHPLECRGSGRTDAGVHARGQVANIRTDDSIPTRNLRSALGDRLPRDVAILDIDEVSPDFDATLSAVSKLYRYSIHTGTRRPVSRLRERFTHHVWHPLDVARMQAAAAHMIGEQDFAAMASAGSVRETTVRTVLSIEIFRAFDELHVDVVGTGFLYKQVRNMVGTLVEVGRGRWPPERVAEIIAGRDRRHAGPTMPAKGLCLRWVRYPADVLTTTSQ